jgi:hypothetical protein
MVIDIVDDMRSASIEKAASEQRCIEQPKGFVPKRGSNRERKYGREREMIKR